MLQAPSITLALAVVTSLSACTVRLPTDPPPKELLTVAETSGFRATARHADVVALVDRLVACSPLARRGTLGTSGEGRELPLLVLSDPPVSTLEQVRSARARGKLVLFAFGDIHAGEVCGKEALPMLARELVLDPERPDHRSLLSRAVLVFAPIYNADGNERFDTNAKNRPGQNGPVDGMGRRSNAKGLDLNRDYMKLEAPESNAMVRFLDEWDPDVVIDTHTTNGSFHRYLVTYAAPLNPAGARAPREWMRDVALPEIGARLLARTGYRTFFYGNFDDAHTTWANYSHEPRFGGNYHGLRATPSILSEAYSYASFEERVYGTLEFVRECLAYCVDHADSLREMKARGAADAIAAGRTGGDAVGIRFELAPAPEKATILGFANDDVSPGPPPPELAPKDYEVTFLDRYAPTLTVTRPRAYFVPKELKVVADKLRAHGIAVETLASPFTGEVEVERVTRFAHKPEPFQGHNETELETTTQRETRTIAAGDFMVRLDQRLGTLALYLLEARSDDGLVAWNFIDPWLAEGSDYPIVRLPPGPPAPVARDARDLYRRYRFTALSDSARGMVRPGSFVSASARGIR